MNTGNMARIEVLAKDNYDTWKLQMQAILTKNDLWEYVCGGAIKPEPGTNNANAAGVQEWKRNDSKACSDIILSISPSELKQIKHCKTSREMWLKLEETYQSKGPARKATLLKSLTLQKMAENNDVRTHLNRFFDSVDKLNDMDVAINPDLLTILLLYSLPSSFENFRCAIESRDELPTPEALRIKILEESDARKSVTRSTPSGAMFVKRYDYSKNRHEKGDGDRLKDGKVIRCFKCKQLNHKANECPKNKRRTQNESARSAENVCLYASSLTGLDPDKKWCLDSGATSHFCNDAEHFSEIDDSNPELIKLANSATSVTNGEGKVHFIARSNDDTKRVTLSNAFHVPDMRQNLLSVSRITDRGFEVLFRKDEALIQDSNKNIVLQAARLDNLYYIRESGQIACISTSAPKESLVSLRLLHRRLGHVNVRDILEGVNRGIVKGIQLSDTDSSFTCNVCLQSKMTRAPFPDKSERQSKTLDLVHTDVCGAMRTASLAGAKYFVEFIDDNTRWCEVRFLKSKDEVFKAFVDYTALVENKKGTTIKCLQSDNGREYLSSEFNEYLKKKGISRRLTVPYNPEQNGIAERKNRSLLETARCLLNESNLPDYFWAEAVNTANYLRNRLPTKSLNGKTPFEAWTGEVPDISDFRVFGSKVYYLNRCPKRGKFDSRGQEGIFLGYADESKAYRVWSPEKRQVFLTRDVKFSEAEHCDERTSATVDSEAGDGRDCSTVSPRFMEFEFPPKISKPPADVDQSSDEEDFLGFDKPITEEASPPGLDNLHDAEDDVPGEASIPGTSRRGRGRPKKVRSGSRGRPRKEQHIVTPCPIEESNKAEQVLLSEVLLKEALSGPDENEWRQAIATEIRSILKNDTWHLVDRPKNKKIVGCRIVLRNKFRPDGVLEKRKARLVAQGFSQQPGIHFTETFAPVARRSTIRLVASLAANHGMMIRQLDVETAYLNGSLEEEVYMKLPDNLHQILRDIVSSEGTNQVGAKARKMLEDLREGNKVCRLTKSLYGLRQAGRSWYTKLDETMKNLGAVPSKHDPCLFHINSGGDATLIATYVDDIIIASRSERKIAEIVTGLAAHFDVKDLGCIKYCLGIEFEQSCGEVTLHQRGYIQGLLSRFGMSDCNAISTPIDPSFKLMRKESQSQDDLKLPYRELVGALTYLASTTRPDIAFTASYLGQFNNCFGADHWTAAKRVLRYLKSTMNLGLRYGQYSSSFKGYTDADWGNCPEDRRSYSGYVFMLNGGPISWDSRKQRTVALSTLESEYMALSECSKEAIFLKRFLAELGFHDLCELTIFCDNRGALTLAENSTYHARSKHIDVRHHFVRDVLKGKEFHLQHVSTADQAADFLTKGLTRPKHDRCIELIGMST